MDQKLTCPCHNCFNLKSLWPSILLETYKHQSTLLIRRGSQSLQLIPTGCLDLNVSLTLMLLFHQAESNGQTSTRNQLCQKSYEYFSQLISLTQKWIFWRTKNKYFVEQKEANGGDNLGVMEKSFEKFIDNATRFLYQINVL